MLSMLNHMKFFHFLAPSFVIDRLLAVIIRSLDRKTLNISVHVAN